MTKLISLVLVAVLASAAAAESKPPTPTAVAAQATIKEIDKMMGFVPAFVRQVPQVLLPSWWEMTKAIDMNPNTALDGKTKELIGLAVAAAAPCEYCIYFHTETAKLNGATEQEIQEAVGIAAITRQGSVLMNGLQVDKQQFKADVQRLVKSAKQGK